MKKKTFNRLMMGSFMLFMLYSCSSFFSKKNQEGESIYSNDDVLLNNLRNKIEILDTKDNYGVVDNDTILLNDFRNKIIKNTPKGFSDIYSYKRAKTLILSKIDVSFMESDTIILIERCQIIPSFSYNSTVYESKNSEERNYRYKEVPESGQMQTNSLVPDEKSQENYVLSMVRRGELDEIQKQGDSYRKIFTTDLIIYIAIRKGNDFFDINVIKTTFFPPPK